MGKYHSELLMLFNLAFLMKCKYNVNIHNIYGTGYDMLTRIWTVDFGVS